jgi:hypothetical protein
VTDGRPEFSPVPSDAPTEDRIGTAVLAMEAAAATAIAWFATLTWIQTRLLSGSTVKSVAEINPHSFDVNFMVYGSVLGMAFAGCTAWILMAPIPSSYRRGGLSMVAAFAGTVIGALLTIPGRGHPIMLLVIAAAAIALALLLGRRAVRSWK